MKFVLTAMFMLITTGAYAQGQSGTGGGRERERGLEHMMVDLIPYLESQEGQNAFPEVRDYNRAHPSETVSDLLKSTAIVLKNGEVKDGFDADRDCVSHFGDPKNRYVECNLGTMLDETKLENQPALYGFLFHEILLQAGIEKPRSLTIPSDYHVSKRMEFHRETFEKVMPGLGKVAAVSTFASTGFRCTTQSKSPPLHSDVGRLELYWKPTGEYLLVKMNLSAANQDSEIEVLLRDHSEGYRLDQKREEQEPFFVIFAQAQTQKSPGWDFEIRTKLEEVHNHIGRYTNWVFATLGYALHAQKVSIDTSMVCEDLDSFAYDNKYFFKIPLDEMFKETEKKYFHFRPVSLD